MSESFDDLISTLDDLSNPEDRCFLCGSLLTKDTYSEEHVIPKWAQRKYNLWNQTLSLLNQSRIRYCQLTIPCCTTCNTVRLEPIEAAISRAVDEHRDAVSAVGSKSLFLWLGKIFYGVLYKEMMLLRDRKDPRLGPIVTKEYIKRYRMHRFFLQQARNAVEVMDFSVGSIFVFRVQAPKEREKQWDLLDTVPGLAVGVRAGKVGIIGALADGGAQELEADLFERYFDLPLHPLQFREIFTRIAYRSHNATRTPKYITMKGEGGRHVIHQLPLGGFSAKPLFEAFEPRDYAVMLSYYTNVPIETVYDAPDGVISWIDKEDGSLQYLDVERYPNW